MKVHRNKPSQIIINRVRKYFPRVNRVVDAKESVTVEVKPRDNKKGAQGKPQDCAMAKACKRALHADGAIINIGVSYIVKGDVATRYKTSTLLGREITSFDRHHDFQPGSYVLGKFGKSQQIGAERGGGGSKVRGKGEGLIPLNVMKKSRTSRIRVTGNGFH